MRKITKNAIECRHCGLILVSTHRHDFRQHICQVAGLVGQVYNHDLKMWEPSHPYIAVDGGNDYVRVLGSPTDYIMRTEYRDE